MLKDPEAMAIMAILAHYGNATDDEVAQILPVLEIMALKRCIRGKYGDVLQGGDLPTDDVGNLKEALQRYLGDVTQEDADKALIEQYSAFAQRRWSLAEGYIPTRLTQRDSRAGASR
jgi:hypothetical protein